jgi:hypothetical protein
MDRSSGCPAFVREVKTFIDTNGVSVPQGAADYSYRLARDLECNVAEARGPHLVSLIEVVELWFDLQFHSRNGIRGWPGRSPRRLQLASRDGRHI